MKLKLFNAPVIGAKNFDGIAVIAGLVVPALCGLSVFLNA